MKALSGPLALLIVAAAIAVSLLREPLPAQERPPDGWEYKVDKIEQAQQVVQGSLQQSDLEGWQYVDSFAASTGAGHNGLSVDAVYIIHRRPKR